MSASAVELAGTAAVLSAVSDQDEGQRRITDLAEAAVRRLWRRMRGRRWSTAWREIGPEVSEIIEQAQVATASRSARYAVAALDAVGMDAADPNPVNPDGFAGVTGAGYPVSSRTYSAVLETVDKYQAARAEGIDDASASRRALLSGEDFLAATAAEILADTMRAAEEVAFAARPWVAGFVRSAEPGACSRCIILAGRFYLFSDGFLRHPLCRCNHLPAPSEKAQVSALIEVSSPRRYFDSLSEREQDKTFGRAGAEAIREGADIGQVVNARRGMTRAQVLGRDVLATTEGTTRRGFAGRRMRSTGQRVRLMPETIAAMAGGDREEYIRLLRANAFLV